MENKQQTGEYQANDAEALVGEIFSGGLTVGDAIERLRTRLLDLSARNRLLNYRHPKGRCVQIADEPNINLVFDRLYVDGKGVPFKYVPEPDPDSYEGKRPEARLYAPRLGISTSFEFEPNPAGSNGRRLHGIQTLLYPADLERQLRKISGEAKTAVEETGSNMLFLVFGFLEFYDSEDSERPMLAPLLSLPVTLAGAARKILEGFSLVARNGMSASRVFAAADQEAEANAILGRFAESADVRRMLGDVFSGAETDLDGLSLTHGWGMAICALDLPTAVRKRLLSEEARVALDDSKRIYRQIDDGCRGARASMEGLSSFGTFSWEDWQASARSNPGRDLPSELVARLYVPAGNPGSVLPWSKYLSLRMQTRQEGLGDFVSALEARKMPSSALAAAFDLAAYQSIGRSIYQAFPELSRFNGTAHEKTRSDYRVLDAEIVSLTGKDFASQIDRKTRVPEGQRGATVGDYTEMHLLRREINKQRRHIPIRQLVKRAGRALQELKPCFMMGPLSVAQYLEQGALKFDLVVMDEASQLRPEEALGAVARGSQLVVVGDPKQLPPTNFFDRMLDAGDDEDEDEAPAAITGMESILDICQQLFTPVRSLRWHYRSHHESLIAFSNHHFYKNLIVFPSPYAKNPGLGVKYRYVRGGIYKDRQNVPEAQRLVDSVLEHMIKRPDESLGVVTLNQTQRELIEELLDKKLKTFEEGAAFMGRWEAEGCDRSARLPAA